MKRSLILVLLFCSLPLVAAEQVAIARYVSDLASANGITVVGINVVGNDTFSPPLKPRSVDKSLARALARFNYIVNYGTNDSIVRVTVLGRKGNSVGAMPEDNVQIEPQVESPPENDY